jgi:hypothetical protein
MNVDRLLYDAAYAGRVGDVGGEDRDVTVGACGLTSSLQSIMWTAGNCDASARFGQRRGQERRGEVAAGGEQGGLPL